MTPRNIGLASLPEDAIPCVWMNAGLITFRLCDRQLDCENCPLDAAFTGRHLTEAAASVPEEGPPRTLEFPADRLYATNHLWLHPQDNDQYLVGLDAMVAALLKRVVSVELPTQGDRHPRGSLMVALHLESGTLTLTAPFNCRVEESNVALMKEPNLLIRAPYETGWMVRISPEDPAPEIGHLLESDGMELRAGLDLRRMRRRLAFHLLAGSTEVGPTLCDGGEPLTDLRQILGAVQYNALIRDLVR